MADKTITIDLEAYELLAAEKRAGESFSEVIKRRLRPARTARALLTRLDDLALDEDTLDRLDELIEARTEQTTASPALDLGD